MARIMVTVNLFHIGNGAQGRNRTTDTRIFSRRLDLRYQFAGKVNGSERRLIVYF
jgi:hypothetical protein